MKKLFLIILLSSSLANAVDYAARRSITTAVPATSVAVNLILSGANYHQLIWTVSGTVTTCQVRLDSSADGTTWSAGDVIAAQTCTSNGSATVATGVKNYVRINVTVKTGSGTVTPVYYAYVNSPIGISAIPIPIAEGGTGSTTGFRLDQVLDPAADKTFAMDVNKVGFDFPTNQVFGTSFFLNPGAAMESGFPAGFNTFGYGEVLGIRTIGEYGSVFASQGSAASSFNTTTLYLEAATSGTFGSASGLNIFTADKGANQILAHEGINIGLKHTSTGEMIEANGIFIQNLSTSGAGITGRATGIQVATPGNAKIATNYGILLADQTGPNIVKGYGLSTGLGQNSFGDRLTVKSNTAAVQPVTFTGTGLNDATSGGTFTGTSDLAYCVQIDASVPSPDTFEWGTGGSCSNGATGVAITGAAQNLSNGVQITSAAIDGHTIGDNWTFTAYAPIPLTLQDHSGNITFRVKELGDSHGRRYFADSGTALVAGDFVPSAGWGATGSVAVTSSSTDQSFHITITGAGGGYGLNPTVAFTFKNGTWTTVPIYVCSMETGGTGALSFFTPDNTSATVLTLTYAGTPGAATYKVACNAWGL